MPSVLRVCFVGLAVLLTPLFRSARAQSPDAPAATLREIRSDGLKSLTEAQVAILAGLQPGALASRDDLQAAADKLVQSGLFAKVKYNFQTRVDGLLVTFHVEEAPRLPAYFDNIPWFTDGELNDAIRAKLPFYDGTLPSAGAVVDQAADAVSAFLVTHGLQAAIEHQALANPSGDGSVQQFHIEGASLRIASLEFSDASLNTSRLVQQQVSELKGKPYSRMAIDLFLTEQIRPIYQKQGYLHAKLGPPEVRLTGNPNQKLPEQIPVYIPIAPGSVYHWKGVNWTGNSVLSSMTLTGDLRLREGDVADGMALEAGWDRVREEYGHRGYLDVKVDPLATYNDEVHSVAYNVRVEEGAPYKYDGLMITGLSTTAEKRLRDAWPIQQGEVFNKTAFEEFLTKLQAHRGDIFGELPIHYDEVGHWLQTDPAKSTVNVLIDFK